MFTEFLTFVLNQEACRKRWHEVEASYAEARNRMKEMEQDILALQTKLKHARYFLFDQLASFSRIPSLSARRSYC